MSIASAIPSVLVAVASVLVDASFRPEQYQDRVGAQILLWLAAALQKAASSEALEIPWALVNLVFFCSLGSAAYMAWIVRWRWSTRQQPNRSDFSRMLAPSSLVPLGYSLVHVSRDARTTQQELLKRSAVLFTSSFAMLCLWQWYRLQRLVARQDLVGMPVVHNQAVHQAVTVDESTWYQWTPFHVLTWIASLDGGDQVDWKEVSGMMAPERIPGSVLEYLTVNDLRSMGLPYGPASQLEHHIQRLASRHPDPQRRLYDNYNEPQYQDDNDMLHSNGWVDQDTSWAQRDEEMLQSQPPASFVKSHEEIDLAMGQRAQDLMRERFGLELPLLRTQEETSDSRRGREVNHGQDAAVGSNRAHVQSTPPGSDQKVGWSPRPQPDSAFGTSASAVSNEASLEGIPPGLLAAMPPHIRDIAARKPHLVRQLLSSRTSPTVEQENTTAGTPTLSRVQELRMQADPSYASRFVGAQAAAELACMAVASGGNENVTDDGTNDVLFESSDEGEQTVLLRRRAPNSNN